MISSQSRPHGFSLEPHKEIISLRKWHEHYIGVLRNVEKREGVTLLEFDDCYVCFYRDLDIEKYLGKNIGVLRTDIDGKEVWVREMKLKEVAI